jgi:hypothetical protein
VSLPQLASSVVFTLPFLVVVMSSFRLDELHPEFDGDSAYRNVWIAFCLVTVAATVVFDIFVSWGFSGGISADAWRRCLRCYRGSDDANDNAGGNRSGGVSDRGEGTYRYHSPPRPTLAGPPPQSPLLSSSSSLVNASGDISGGGGGVRNYRAGRAPSRLSPHSKRRASADDTAMHSTFSSLSSSLSISSSTETSRSSAPASVASAAAAAAAVASQSGGGSGVRTKSFKSYSPKLKFVFPTPPPTSVMSPMSLPMSTDASETVRTSRTLPPRHPPPPPPLPPTPSLPPLPSSPPLASSTVTPTPGFNGNDNGNDTPLLRPREKLLLGTPRVYYAAIVASMFLRGLWVITIMPFPEETGFTLLPAPLLRWLDSLTDNVFTRQLLLTTLVAAELARFCAWTALRVEREHLRSQTGLQQLAYAPVFFDSKQQMAERRRALGDDGHTSFFYSIVCHLMIMYAALAALSALVDNSWHLDVSKAS